MTVPVAELCGGHLGVPSRSTSTVRLGQCESDPESPLGRVIKVAAAGPGPPKGPLSGTGGTRASSDSDPGSESDPRLARSAGELARAAGLAGASVRSARALAASGRRLQAAAPGHACHHRASELVMAETGRPARGRSLT